MNKTIKKHLERCTKENIESWRKYAFAQFSSCHHKGVFYELGVDGYGNFEIRVDGDFHIGFKGVDEAFEAYKKLF